MSKIIKDTMTCVNCGKPHAIDWGNGLCYVCVKKHSYGKLDTSSGQNDENSINFSTQKEPIVSMIRPFNAHDKLTVAKRCARFELYTKQNKKKMVSDAPWGGMTAPSNPGADVVSAGHTYGSGDMVYYGYNAQPIDPQQPLAYYTEAVTKYNSTVSQTEIPVYIDTNLSQPSITVTWNGEEWVSTCSD